MKKKQIVLPEAPTPEMPNLKERGIKPLVYEPPDTIDDDDRNSSDDDESTKSLNIAVIHERRDTQTEIALRQLTAQPFELDGVSFCLPVKLFSVCVVSAFSFAPSSEETQEALFLFLPQLSRLVLPPFR